MATTMLPALDGAVAAALVEPDLAANLRRQPHRAEGLLQASRDTARQAWAEGDPEACEIAHRTLYRLYEQSAWSPLAAPRANQHDLTLAAVLLELERGFEGWLAGFELPESPPKDGEAYAAWLADIALERDFSPQIPSSQFGSFMRSSATLQQMREIVAQRSLFFLKEPDPWAMVIPSLRGEPKAALLDLLLDEYGWGRHDQMHSTVYEQLMAALELDTGYDTYFDATAWQYLASLNLQNMYARHRRLCRRMYGYIYLVEADSPLSMVNYIEAYKRLGRSEDAVLRFYELHITADEGHQDLALNEVIRPIVSAESRAGTEIARGVLEGRAVHALFSSHLAACFASDRTSLRLPL